MRLASIFTHFPYTLLVCSLAFATNALPVESTELLVLTPDNFKETIAHGVWFIEHFSPYCGHCRRFAPTWKQLVEHYESQADPGVHLAQVNCAVHGDLCRENNVDGYPQMNLYSDGKFVETYKKGRDFDLLTEYLSPHLQPTSTPSSSVPVPPLTTEAVIETRQPIAETYSWTLPEAKTYNSKGQVTILNAQTFQDAVSEGHLFVKFFAPWCGHCKKMAPIWIELARQMRGKLNVAEVNCEEHSSLCTQQGITGYPMLFYYPSAKANKMEYTGGRKVEQLVAFSERLSGPPVLELSEGELSQVVADHPVAYLLLLSASDTRSAQQVIDASHVLFGTPPIYVSTSTALFQHFSSDPSTSVLLALKDHEGGTPAAHFNVAHSTKKDLETWLLRHKLPTVLELHMDTFQEVMNAPHHPLVVLVATSKAETATVVPQLKEIAMRWKNRRSGENVVFTWMESDKWGSWLKSMYGIKGPLPQVVITNHTKLIYYNVDQHGEKISLTSSSILSAITGASHGTIPYRNSENFVERMARYLNDKMQGVERFVSSHPWMVVAFVITGVVGLFFLFKRLLSDDLPADAAQYRKLDTRGKSSRLD